MILQPQRPIAGHVVTADFDGTAPTASYYCAGADVDSADQLAQDLLAAGAVRVSVEPTRRTAIA